LVEGSGRSTVRGRRGDLVRGDEVSFDEGRRREREGTNRRGRKDR
jgi:hypothetical protein